MPVLCLQQLDGSLIRKLITCSTDGEKFNSLSSSTYFIYSKLMLYCLILNDEDT